MNKLLAALTLAVAVGLLTLTLTGIAGAASNTDSAKGNGTTVNNVKFSFKAADLDGNPTTFEAKGKFNYASTIPGNPYYKGEVTCLNVLGQGARFVAKITKSDNPTFLGYFAEVHVLDSGQKGGEGDEFTVREFHGSDPGCATPPLPPGDPLTKGNVVVNDVP